MPSWLGLPELLVILVIVVLIFGVGRLPEVGEALGKAIRDFREAVSGKNEDTAEKESDKDES
jgi:sec-independent protein translocase protein TatA